MQWLIDHLFSSPFQSIRGHDEHLPLMWRRTEPYRHSSSNLNNIIILLLIIITLLLLSTSFTVNIQGVKKTMIIANMSHWLHYGKIWSKHFSTAFDQSVCNLGCTLSNFSSVIWKRHTIWEAFMTKKDFPGWLVYILSVTWFRAILSWEIRLSRPIRTVYVWRLRNLLHVAQQIQI